MTALFAATVFLNGALLMALQPLAARRLTPMLGGSPAVWLTCLLFFQVALIIGYAAAWRTARLPRRWQLPPLVLFAALGAATAPMLPSGPMSWTGEPSIGHPRTWLLLTLLVGTLPAYVAVSILGPLVQHWYELSGRSAGRLVAWSNGGSLIGLLAYPLLIEPELGLGDQAQAWRGLLLIVGAMAALCWRLAGSSRAHLGTASRAPRPIQPTATARRAAVRRWIGLSAIPCALSMSTTQFLAAEVVSAPLLWAVPLALYFATFIVAFSRHGTAWLRAAALLLPGLAIATLVAMLLDIRHPLLLHIFLHLATMAAAGIVWHGLLAASRPPPVAESSEHTRFLLAISIGGAAGGALVAVVAPLILNDVYEHPILIAVAASIVSSGRVQSLLAGQRRNIVAMAAGVIVVAAVGGVLATAVPMDAAQRTAVLLIVLLGGIAAVASVRPRLYPAAASCLGVFVMLAPSSRGGTIDLRRTFFGVHRVVAAGPDQQLHQLWHGTTLHGVQDMSLPSTGAAHVLGYYHPDSPIAELWARAAARGNLDRIAVAGLGAGGLAMLVEPGQHIDFFEIDPAVVAIATDPRCFTAISGCAGETRIVTADARIGLAREAAATYDLIILDAFTSDSIPVHLMTVEAIEMYRERLAPGGLLAFNISNRHFDLAPGLAAIAAAAGMPSVVAQASAPDRDQLARGIRASRWMVLAPSESDLAALSLTDRWQRVPPTRTPWTDERSSVIRALKLRQ